MDDALLVSIGGAIVVVIGAIGKFIKDSRLGDVISSESRQEETAVTKMASILEYQAQCDEKTLDRLMQMLDKALDTVARLTGSMQSIALGLQGHEQDASLRWAQEQDTSHRILRELDAVKATVADLERLVTDLMLQILKERNEAKVGKDDTSVA